MTNISEVDDEICSKEHPLLEIEAKSCKSNNNMLVRVVCEKRKGVIPNLIDKIESLNMFIVNANSVSFGQAAMDITIVAQIEDEVSLSVEEVAESIRVTLQTNE